MKRRTGNKKNANTDADKNNDIPDVNIPLSSSFQIDVSQNDQLKKRS